MSWMPPVLTIARKTTAPLAGLAWPSRHTPLLATRRTIVSGPVDGDAAAPLALGRRLLGSDSSQCGPTQRTAVAPLE
jgi:hypothetical protein